MLAEGTSQMIKYCRLLRARNNMLQQTLLVVLGLTFVVSRPDPFYRKDYTYVDQFDAFYKLHWDLAGVSWGSAFLACDDEESTLFYPKMKDEWTVVKNLVSPMKVKPNVSDIFVGIHDEFGLGQFITVDGLPTPAPILEGGQPLLEGLRSCVTMDIENGTYILGGCEAANAKPFVCKKKVVVPCSTVDTGYVYVQQVNKCYKINQRKKTWLDAMKTCFLEGGVLAVIGNAAEATIISDKIKNYNDYFVGFQRLFPNGDFFTVKGHKLDDTCYSNWRNRYEDDTMNDCGIIVKSGNGNGLYTRTKNCIQTAPFVCEMTPNV